MDSAAGVVEWSVFAVVVGLVLAIDLVASRGKEQPSMRAAMAWSGVWIGLGLVFGGWIAWRLGSAAGVSYLTAYLLEKSLSVDNLFLFLLIFEQTGIPANLQRRALLWGVFGALVMRALLIGAGLLQIRGRGCGRCCHRFAARSVGHRNRGDAASRSRRAFADARAA